MINCYTKEFFFGTSSSFVFSLHFTASIFDKRLRRHIFFKPAFNYYSLTNPSPDEERERDRSRDVVNEEEGDIDDESEVELDGNDQLDLDSEHNDKTLPEQFLSLRILIFYTPPHQLSFSNFS